MSHSNHIELTVVVNGQPISVEVNASDPLQTVITLALAKSGNAGQPAQNWELRDAEGRVLVLSRPVGEFGFNEHTKLFLSLKAGVGGTLNAISIH